MSKILIIVGHPREGSFSEALAKAYCEGARLHKYEVRLRNLAALNMDFALPKRKSEETTEWVLAMQEDIDWCEHIVIVTPLWWGGVPARLKEYIDRVFAPEFAYRYSKGGAYEKLLKGRSARLIVVSDTPPFFFRWLMGWPLVKQFQMQILGFCGFSPIRTTLIGPVRASKESHRRHWIKQVAQLGTQAR